MMSVEEIIPLNLLDEAREIVDGYHPTDPNLRGFDPQFRLAAADHQTLNSGEFTLNWDDQRKAAKFAELRVKYADDPDALAEIDVFDTTSDAYQKLKLLADLLNTTAALKNT